MNFWHATLDTTHFTFDAYGLTEEEAKDALIMGMQKHAKQTGIDEQDFVNDYEDGININAVSMGGAAYRDYELIPTPEGWGEPEEDGTYDRPIKIKADATEQEHWAYKHNDPDQHPECKLCQEGY